MVKNAPTNSGEAGSVPESGRFPWSSILTRNIPGAEEPGRLQSMRPQRIRHD